MTERKKADIVKGKLTVKASKALAEQIKAELEIPDPGSSATGLDKDFVDADGFIQLSRENNALSSGCSG